MWLNFKSNVLGFITLPRLTTRWRECSLLLIPLSVTVMVIGQNSYLNKGKPPDRDVTADTETFPPTGSRAAAPLVSPPSSPILPPPRWLHPPELSFVWVPITSQTLPCPRSWQPATGCLSGFFRVEEGGVDGDFALQTPAALPRLWSLARHKERHPV